VDLICLAAGRGVRFGRLGSYLQKCMYPVGLRPFVEHALAQVLASGAARPGRDRLAFVVGHHGEQLRAYFGDTYGGLSVTYVEQPVPEGTGQALWLAGRALTPTASVLAWTADALPRAATVAALVAHPAPNVVTLGPGDPGESDALRATVEGGRLRRVWHGVDDRYDVGLWKLAPDVLARLTEVRAEDGEVRLLPNLQRVLDDGAEVGFVETDDWIHLGGTLPTPEANVRAVVARVAALADETP
jgi:UDP-N-acetylglucosamine diphosphorylase / glucose-1-phosphate thymidylyltransferase / UDP-N-acetylgalactosamine diphosphorylase / glucosamine-1-phosphate N-acetyltransferase / galactosamine-1-phosphate N-acetyltransferase